MTCALVSAPWVGGRGATAGVLLGKPAPLASRVKFVVNAQDSKPTPINPDLRVGLVSGYSRDWIACPGGGACRTVGMWLYCYRSARAPHKPAVETVFLSVRREFST